MFILKGCGRCHGDLLRTEDGDFACLQCGATHRTEIAVQSWRPGAVGKAEQLVRLGLASGALTAQINSG